MRLNELHVLGLQPRGGFRARAGVTIAPLVDEFRSQVEGREDGSHRNDTDHVIAIRRELCDQIRPSRDESGAQARHAVNLRKGSCHDDVFPVAHVLHRAFDVGRRAKVQVRFVDQQERLGRQVVHQPGKLLLVGHRRRRIVRIADVNDTAACLFRLGDQLLHVGRVVGSQRNFHYRVSLDGGQFRHGFKRRPAGDERARGRGEHVDHVVQTLGRSRADQHLVPAQFFAGRDGFIEIVELAVVVTIGFPDHAFDRLQDRGRMSLGKFVGVKPDRVFGRDPGDVGALGEGEFGESGRRDRGKSAACEPVVKPFVRHPSPPVCNSTAF